MSNVTAARDFFRLAAAHWRGEAEHTLNSALHTVGAEVLEQIRDDTPVQTGRLRDGWRLEVNGVTMTLYNTVPYASEVEYGRGGAMLRLNTLPETIRSSLRRATRTP
jgi:hypothetical protein